ncbi:uncharacterized protein [Mobula birostris]|uniref:uncharacterized protein n=1 Tax=Mobula birostris TaxID=1983395 RepID=UPI003B280272
MDDRKNYMDMTFTKTDSRSPSRVEPDVLYADINFKAGSRPRVRTDRAGLNSTYSELNFRKEEHRIDEDEDPPITSGPGGLPTTDKTDHMGSERPARRDRSDSRIWLICVLTTALVITGICWWFHVSQIRQSMITSDRNCTETGRKDRSVNEIKAQICDLLSSKRDQPCSKHWIRNKDRCYYVSTVDTSSFRAMQECSNSDSRLLEINSRDEANFVSRKLVDGDRSYWIGKCENWNVALAILYKVSSVTSDCKDCYSYPGSYPCNRDRRFICEKSAPLLPEIPERIHNLCQQPMETT